MRRKNRTPFKAAREEATTFNLRVCHDEMAPHVCDGDVVRLRPPRAGELPEPGSTVLVGIRGPEGLRVHLRLFQPARFGSLDGARLVATNGWPDEVFDENCELLAVWVGLASERDPGRPLIE